MVAIDNQKAALLGMDEFFVKLLHISSMYSKYNGVPIYSNGIICLIPFCVVN